MVYISIVCKTSRPAGCLLDFRKVLSTISLSGAPFGTSNLARSVSSIYLVGLFLGFLPFSAFLSYLHIVPLPKILASRLVASLTVCLKPQFPRSRRLQPLVIRLFLLARVPETYRTSRAFTSAESAAHLSCACTVGSRI